jgi:hypothetical protein
MNAYIANFGFGNWAWPRTRPTGHSHFNVPCPGQLM